jgi:hypothetical protein
LAGVWVSAPEANAQQPASVIAAQSTAMRLRGYGLISGSKMDCTIIVDVCGRQRAGPAN